MHNLTRNLFSGLLIFAAGAEVFGLDTPPAATPPGVAAEATVLGPKIQFATPIYDFGRVKSGELVKYSYVFTNTGDQLLEVSAVQPSCGCTTAGDWTHKVMPGETGKVAIQFNSANFNGPVIKTISVSSNDKRSLVTPLQLKGTIWKPIEIAPSYALMNVPPDAATAATSVRIINNTDEPLALSAPECSNQSFNVILTTNRPGKEFQLSIASVGALTMGNVQGKVTIRTSSTNAPLLDVPFMVYVQPAVAIMPAQISLPRAPLTVKAPTTITIQNRSTNALSLTDPALNVPGVDVEIKEIEPGKVYHALLTFPEGFEIPAGQPVALTVKSSNPRLPEIRVPVFQAPRAPVTAPPLKQGAYDLGNGVIQPARPAIAPPPVPPPPAGGPTGPNAQVAR